MGMLSTGMHRGDRGRQSTHAQEAGLGREHPARTVISEAGLLDPGTISSCCLSATSVVLRCGKLVHKYKKLAY